MSIETLEDWNARLACCCDMPLCPLPVIKAKSASLNSMRVCGVSSNGIAPPLSITQFPHALPGTPEHPHYLKKVVEDYFHVNEEIPDESGGGRRTYTRTITTTTNYFYTLDPDSSTWVACSSSTSSQTVEDGDSFAVFVPTDTEDYELAGDTSGFTATRILSKTGISSDPEFRRIERISVTLSDAIENNIEYLIEQATEIIAIHGFETNPSYFIGSESTSSLTITQTDGDGNPVVITYRSAQITFSVNQGFKGNYFKVTYDILESPTVGSPMLVSQDNTLEWNRPNKEILDPEDYDFDPFVLPPPSAPGIVEIVNIRYQCYRSTRYGNPPPQVTGEAF